MSEGGYIQGAGDDSEGWAHGLTPPVFWANQDVLKRTAEEDLPDLIADLVAEHQQQRTGQEATLISPTKNLFLSPTDPGVNGSGRYNLVIDCNGAPDAVGENPKRLNLGCALAKLGSRDLRKSLNKVRDFVNTQLGSDPSQSLLVTCDTGKDLSAGALLAIICQFYNENGMLRIQLDGLKALDAKRCWESKREKLIKRIIIGEFDASLSKRSISKQFIRQRLAWIVSSNHNVNPSRSTLQSVNAFLMEPPDY